GTEAERVAEPRLVALAYGKGIPLVATNECYFAGAGDYEAHDALLAIAEGRLVSDAERRQVTPEHRYKPHAAMIELFRDIPEAVENTVEIARRCAFRPRSTKPMLPRFTQDGDEAAELRRQAQEGLRKRLSVHGLAPGVSEEDYAARLDFELGVIERMKF